MTDTITLPRSVLEQALNALEMMGVPSPLVFLPDEIKSWQTVQAELSAALEQPQVEQSSVVGVIGWKNHLPNSGTVVHWTALMPPLGTKLYTHPQPPSQPLTDQQIHDCFQHRHRDKATERRMITRAIEFAHGITGEQA